MQQRRTCWLCNWRRSVCTLSVAPSSWERLLLVLMFWAGRVYFCPLLWDIVTEGNEDFERAESENCCYGNMKAKYDLSTVSNPIKCKIPFSISVYYTSCVECESFMVLQQRLSWISPLSFHFTFSSPAFIILLCSERYKAKTFH